MRQQTPAAQQRAQAAADARVLRFLQRKAAEVRAQLRAERAAKGGRS